MTIGVRDGKGGKVRQLTLTRAEVTLPNVSRRIETVDGRKLGYVRLLSFSEGAHGQLAGAVRQVQKEGAKGIVLDLRHNPGGLLEEAVRTASLFLPEGRVVVSTKSRSQGESTYETSGARRSKLPLVVLIDGGTASAAEILTAALADDGGAEVVGTRSFGKGVFQEEQSARQRRGAEADGRRILHPEGGQPCREPRDPSRRQGPGRPEDEGRRGRTARLRSPRRPDRPDGKAAERRNHHPAAGPSFPRFAFP